MDATRAYGVHRLAADFSYIDYPEEPEIISQPAYFPISASGMEAGDRRFGLAHRKAAR